MEKTDVEVNTKLQIIIGMEANMKTIILFLSLCLGIGFSENGQVNNNFRLLFSTGVIDSAVNPQPAALAYKTYQEARGRMLGHTLIPLGAGYFLMALGNGKDYNFSDDSNYLVIPGVFLASYSSLIGPSMGNLYAQDLERGIGGIGVRLLGGALIYAGSAYLAEGKVDDLFYDDNSSIGTGYLSAGMGTALYLGSAIYNNTTTRLSVEQYNKRNSSEVSVKLAPAIDSATSKPIVSLGFAFR